MLLFPQYGTHSLLAFTLVLHHILSIVFLKPTVSIRPSVPPSGSHKCLRFGLWLTLCTRKGFIYIYLLTYLLTYITIKANQRSPTITITANQHSPTKTTPANHNSLTVAQKPGFRWFNKVRPKKQCGNGHHISTLPVTKYKVQMSRNHRHNEPSSVKILSGNKNAKKSGITNTACSF